MSADVGEITRLLGEAGNGNKTALDRLAEMVYADLYRLAAKHLQRQFGAGARQISLEPSALVHETYLRLVKQRKTYDSLGHFFAIATRVMLRVLIDYHRQKKAGKRGAGMVRVTLTGLAEAAPETPDLPDLVIALEQLENLDPRGAEVVKLRVLWGLTVPEIAETMEISPSTVEREWRFARRWLAAHLTDDS